MASACIFFSLWVVLATPNFFASDIATKQSTQRAIFLFYCRVSYQRCFVSIWYNGKVVYGYIWARVLGPMCLCYRTSKSRFSDHGIQQGEGDCQFAFSVWFIYLKITLHPQVSQVGTSTCERTTGHPTTAGSWVRIPPWFFVFYAFFAFFFSVIFSVQLCAAVHRHLKYFKKTKVKDH